MIAIRRGTEPPALEKIRRWRLGRLYVDWVDADRPRRFESVLEQGHLNRGYNLKPVRERLRAQQHRKCAFCERSEIPVTSHIEHFRPRRSEESENDELSHAGYPWLTWTWENLLLACSDCNLAKSTHFPVDGDRLPPFDFDIEREAALLLDPTRDQPRKHIRFRLDEGLQKWRPVGRTPRGEATLEVLKLWKYPVEAFDQHVEQLEEFVIPDLRAASGTTDSARKWQREMRRLFAPSAPFHLLSYDVLDSEFPHEWRSRHGVELPSLPDPVPTDVPRPFAQGELSPSPIELSSYEAALAGAACARSKRVRTEMIHRLISQRESWLVSDLLEVIERSEAVVNGTLDLLERKGRLARDGDIVKAIDV